MRIIALLFSITLFISVAKSQTNLEIAQEKKNKAIELMDNGNPGDAIKLLEEAKTLDPTNFEYDYEIGYAFYIKEDYKKALKCFEKVMEYDNITDQCYQMLGNLFDMNGKPDQALRTYDKGLELFPGSGKLYLEKGNVYWNQQKYGDALPFYEKGIEEDPAFPSNYYRAALIYLNSEEEVWGMIYGEIFMNLIRNSTRTAEISKMLFDTYKSQIQFTSDTSFSVSFSRGAAISINDLSNPDQLKLPFGIGAYEPALMMAVIGEKTIDINSLDRIRTRFVENYYSNKTNEKFPNILFDYHKIIVDSGYFEAYNHWILMKGDEEAFFEWKTNNNEKWESFIKWFTNNALEITEDKRFYSGQY